MQAQWNYTFGNDTTNQEGYSLVYTSDGNYAIGGTTIWEGEKAMFLIKVNEYGEELWYKIYEQEDRQWDSGKLTLKETENNGFIFLGNKLIKTNRTGNIEWAKLASGNNLLVSKDHYIVFKWDLPRITMEYSKDGDKIWEINNPFYYGTNSICIFRDTLIMFYGHAEIGTSQTGPLSQDMLFFTHLDGTSLTQAEYQIINNSPFLWYWPGLSMRTNFINNTNDGGLVFCGYNYNNTNMQITKFDSNLLVTWSKFYNLNSQNQSLIYIEQTHDNGFIAIGSGVIRTDENGDTLWTRLDINGQEIHQINDSSFVLVRTEIDSSGNKDINIIKLTDKGKIAGDFITPSPPTIKGKLINIIDFTGRKTKEKPNLPLIYIYDDGTTEKKMIIE
jgi:hypothetical protein|tara:strand:+ start:85 stop:1248 length:1164 start_codon:yes stop_codon:yes gene_type:complete